MGPTPFFSIVGGRAVQTDLKRRSGVRDRIKAQGHKTPGGTMAGLFSGLKHPDWYGHMHIAKDPWIKADTLEGK